MEKQDRIKNHFYLIFRTKHAELRAISSIFKPVFAAKHLNLKSGEESRIYDMAYSYDLRVKALECLKKSLSKVEVSRSFGIAVPALFKWINREKAGCLAPCKKTKKKTK